MNFTHLHVHTEYSLLDGSNKINEYVSRVKELGMKSATITDHGVMFGCIDFYKAAKVMALNQSLDVRFMLLLVHALTKKKEKKRTVIIIWSCLRKRRRDIRI